MVWGGGGGVDPPVRELVSDVSIGMKSFAFPPEGW